MKLQNASTKGKQLEPWPRFTELTNLKESQTNTHLKMTELLNDHETVIVSLRKESTYLKENKNIGTADFLTGMLQEHETIAWILRRYLS
jgi:starvation-inducible DNA-binding protein